MVDESLSTDEFCAPEGAQLSLVDHTHECPFCGRCDSVVENGWGARHPLGCTYCGNNFTPY